jgi:hypothetical protein
MRGALPPLPQYVFMGWCSVKHRDNFTLLYIPRTCMIQVTSQNFELHMNTGPFLSSACFSILYSCFIIPSLRFWRTKLAARQTKWIVLSFSADNNLSSSLSQTWKNWLVYWLILLVCYDLDLTSQSMNTSRHSSGTHWKEGDRPIVSSRGIRTHNPSIPTVQVIHTLDGAATGTGIFKR